MERAKARAETVLEDEAVRERRARKVDIFGIGHGWKVKGPGCVGGLRLIAWP